jgi:hypothetical protein
MTLGLSDSQLRYVAAAAQPLPIKKRSLFLRRLAAHLEVRGVNRHPSDADIEAAVRMAPQGPVQLPAAELDPA